MAADPKKKAFECPGLFIVNYAHSRYEHLNTVVFKQKLSRAGTPQVSQAHFTRMYYSIYSINRPGARFSKVPIINGPLKLLLFTCKIEVSRGLHLT